jgi:acyl carrier protein
MDPDDLDDIYFEVAEKLGISKEDAEANPYYDKVETVKDLVLFLNEQPRVNNA